MAFNIIELQPLWVVVVVVVKKKTNKNHNKGSFEVPFLYIWKLFALLLYIIYL